MTTFLTFALRRWPAAMLSLTLAAGATAASAAADGVTRTTLLIGQTITLQGGKNAYGMAVQDGIAAYLKAANAQGGVHGRQILLKTLDDDNSGTKAEANARDLVLKEKAFILFGSIEGGPSTAVMKAAVDLKVPFFGPMAGSPTLRRPHQPLVFPVRAEHRDEFRALLEHARSLGMTRAAFVRSDSETGLQHLENVRILCQQLKMELVADLPFKSSIGDPEITAMAQRIGTSGAQVVINHGGAGMYEQLIRKSRALGVKASFSAVNSGSAQLAEKLGDLAHGMVFAQVVPNPMERKTEIAREYRDVFARLQPGKPFSYGSLEGYLTAKALVAALKLAGPEPTRESFVQGLVKAGVVDINGLRLKYQPGDYTGLTLVDLAIYTRENRFMH
ncbi:MAG: braC1 [Ramlibacter sp.]|jgi:ABC-type branched-subunit amino acid transport system substrate-binding protein|nr:braC1 [Ramlibacter sp.]MCE3273524.1 braC1 [Ramlibacter sp.]